VTAQNAQLVVDVTESYYNALLSVRLAEIAEASLAQAEETLRLSELAFQVGDKAEFEVLRARVARNNQRNAVVQQGSNRDLAFLALKQMLNIPLDQPVLLTTVLGDSAAAEPVMPNWISPNASDTSTEARVAVRQAAENVRIQEEQIQVAKAQGRPNLSFNSGYGLIAYPAEMIPGKNDIRDNWTVGLSISMPIFSGGRVSAGVAQAQGSAGQAAARLQQTREIAALDTQSKVEALERARSAWEVTAGTVEEAIRAYQTAELRFQQGLSNLIEVNDARLALSQAQADRAQAARDLYVAQVQLALVRDLPLGSAQPVTGSQFSGATPSFIQTTGMQTQRNAANPAARTNSQTGAGIR
jgi:outer membrane protein TolC